MQKVNKSTPYTFTINYNNKEIVFNVKKSLNSKKISLKPCFKTFSGKLIIPSFISYPQAKNIAKKHIDWLYNILNRFSPQSFLSLNKITLLGKIVTIKAEPNIKNSIFFKDNILEIHYTNTTNILSKIKKYLQDLLKDYTTKAVEYYIKNFNVTYNKIILRENTTRWGSCSTNKNISINWRLIFAPKEILDYVILHEVAHLVYFNHSKNFWQLVEKYQPNYKAHKLWLKQNGYSLYTITF